MSVGMHSGCELEAVSLLVGLHLALVLVTMHVVNHADRSLI